MIATDIDGTIYDRAVGITQATRDAFAECLRRGVAVVLVTGRPLRWVKHTFDDLGLDVPAICSNGAVTVAGSDLRITALTALSHGDVAASVDAALALWPHAHVSVETPTGQVAPQATIADGAMGECANSVATPADLADVPDVIKVLVRTRHVLADDMIHQLNAQLDGPHATHSNATDSLAEIAPRGISKAAALERLCQEMNITPADVVTFGDMPNDIPMLTWAGRSYAMTGGHPDAIAAATHTAPPCTDNGVAQTIVNLLAR